jgi:hypothetical protein
MASTHIPPIENPTRERGRKVAILLAEFDTPGGAMHAAEKLRDAGYSFFDAHTPFPVHGMDRAMGMRDSRLGWIVLAMAITGFSCAAAMITYMNGIDYPLVIGGKPPISIPSMVPVCFELTILFSAFGAVFGMFGLNKLPRHHHPLFESERFKAATDDKFFISVEAHDPKFDDVRTRELLNSAHPVAIESIMEEIS